MLKATNAFGYNYHSLLITKSRIKEYINKNGLECSRTLFNVLNSKIENMLNKSITQAKNKARKRLSARDV